MRILQYKIVIVFLIFLTACKTESSITIEIKNNSSLKRIDEIVEIDLSKISFSSNNLAAYCNSVKLSSQFVDDNSDGRVDSFLFLINLKPNEKKIVRIKAVEEKSKFQQRAHAEISEKIDYKLVDGVYTGGKFVNVKRTKTPEGHRDHNLYYKCEGPCWESDKVGYRFYLDQRNRNDIFGKKVNDMVLPRIHDINNKAYHNMENWGMDIFKVGNSLGIGSFAAYINNTVIQITKTDSIISLVNNDGPILASVSTKYFGWQVEDKKLDVNSLLSISAGSRLTKVKQITSENNINYCTGIAKHDNTEFIKSDNNNEWNYIALWGKQTVINNNLGIAIFFRKVNNPFITEDKLNHIVVLELNKNDIVYYFAACWEHEKNGITTKEEFIKYLEYETLKLNNPLSIKVNE